MKNSKDTNKQLELASAHLDQRFGSGTVMFLDSDPQPWPAISTGVFSLDHALGIGGFPRGRIVEVFGLQGSGKSTLSMTTVAESQKLGETCAYIDIEHALDPQYAKRLGVDLGKLVFSQPSSGEEAIDIAEALIKTEALSVLVIDSVAALTPRAELEGTMDDNSMALQPRLMAKAMRRLPPIAAQAKTLIIFVNQIRQRPVPFGNPNTTPGGMALRFAASVRVELKNKGAIASKNGAFPIGSHIEANIIKNKLAPPLRVARFDLLDGKGFNNLGCIVDMAEELEIFHKKGGGWYSYGDEKLGQGRDNAVAYLASDLDFADKIKEEIINASS